MFETLDILIPGARRSSYRVTCGPLTLPTILDSTPKWLRASTSCWPMRSSAPDVDLGLFLERVRKAVLGSA